MELLTTLPLTSSSLFLISLIAPMATLLLLSLFVARNGWDIHNSLAGCFIAWLIAGVVTNIVKMAVGRPRPDLIARCIPKAGAHDRPVFGLSDISICTTEDWHRLNDGFKVSACAAERANGGVRRRR